MTLTRASTEAAARVLAADLFRQHHAATGGHRERFENQGPTYQAELTKRVLAGVTDRETLFDRERWK